MAAHTQPTPGTSPALSECNFAALPEDALSNIYALLPAYSLRAAAAVNAAWCHALWRAPVPVRQRASWRHHWTRAGGGASIGFGADSAVCTGDGTWHGGVALASTLRLSSAQDSGFRLVVEAAAPGDLLMGITLHPEAATPAASADGGSGGVGGGGGPGGPTPLEMGYNYMMGRRCDADGSIQTSALAAPGGGGGVAPRSIFYGGRSRRCCFATPTAHSSGPSIDMGRDGRSPATLAKLRRVGDWVEFSLAEGSLSATDHAGHTHAWGTRVADGEVWVPTVAWTGSRAAVRLAPPELRLGARASLREEAA